MDDIKVSVIMPVYNSGTYLKTAVESILNQSLKEIELILVDDGSTDGSSEKCDEYAMADSRVVVIHQKNGGICAARNAALDVARGEYIAFSDHDDEYMPGLLLENYELAKASGADIVKFGSHWELIEDDKVIRSYQHKFDDRFYDSDDIRSFFWTLHRGFAFNLVWDGLFKASFLKDNDIKFDTSYKTGGEDNDFMLKCIAAGASIKFNPNVYYKHYVRQGFSTSATFKVGTIQSCIDKSLRFAENLQKAGIEIEQNKSDYTAFWLERVLGQLCMVLADKRCNLAKSKKIETLKSLKTMSHYRPWLMSNSLFELKKKAEPKYLALYIIYKYGLYGLCLSMYSMRS